MGKGAAAAKPQHRPRVEENYNRAGAFLPERQVVLDTKHSLKHDHDGEPSQDGFCSGGFG
jgi:hypothetical protein